MKLITVKYSLAAVLLSASLATALVAQTSDTTAAKNCPLSESEAQTATANKQKQDEQSPGEPGDKVAVCHKPGTPAQKTLFLPPPAARAHMGHGDTPGACGS